MGMFDYMLYKNQEYQTKDTPNQALDYYKIEVDQESGHEFLWVEEYDAEWVEDKDSFLGGYIHQFNKRWVRCDKFDGSIDFYRNLDKTYKKWEEFHTLFMDGRLLKIVKSEENDE